LDLSKVTLPRVIAALALLSLVGWIWFIVNGDMPAAIALLLCGVAPVVLFVLSLHWLNEWAGSERTSSNQ
jgi:hypothetical protein